MTETITAVVPASMIGREEPGHLYWGFVSRRRLRREGDRPAFGIRATLSSSETRINPVL